MDSTTFDSEEDGGYEAGEWSTAQPRVWTFYFNFSNKYLQAILSRCGLEYSFESPRPKGAPRQTFLKELKFEQYANRIRVHSWEILEVFEGGEPWLPGQYYWFDIHDIPEKGCPLWGYRFTHNLGTPDYSMHVSLEWRNKEDLRLRYRIIKWALRYARDDSPGFERKYTEETFFEIPLDVNRLGNRVGDFYYDVVEKGDRQIYCTEEFYPFEREWQCRSGKGTAWEWDWCLRLQTFDATGTVIRDR